MRSGSKRLQRIGDVDGWDGGRLAISAEVKQYVLTADDVSTLVVFANSTNSHGSIGIVATLGFDSGVRDQVEILALIPTDKNDILQIIALWDTVKQRIASTSRFYYIRHVEKNSTLIERVEAFVKKETAGWNAMTTTMFPS